MHTPKRPALQVGESISPDQQHSQQLAPSIAASMGLDRRPLLDLLAPSHRQSLGRQ